MFNLPSEVLVSKKNILEHLARLIIEGRLRTDEIMPTEMSLSSHFGVSRTMVRDILKTLESKGFIERKTNVGTRIRSIHSWNLLDQEVLDWSCGALTQSRFLLSLLELRLIIEPQAAALAAVRANDVDLQQIRAHYQRMSDSVKKEPDPRAILDTEADIDFHKAIMKASGNLFVSQFGGAIRAALHHTIYLSNKATLDVFKSLECHHKVLEAIENRNSEAAYLSMAKVLNNTITDLGLQTTGLIMLEGNSLNRIGSFPETLP